MIIVVLQITKCKMVAFNIHTYEPSSKKQECYYGNSDTEYAVGTNILPMVRLR